MVLSVRLKEHEAARVKELLSKKHMTNSEWVRQLVYAALREESK